MDTFFRYAITFLLGICLLVTSSKIQAQSPVLERQVSLKRYDEKLRVILDEIAEMGNVNFSYNSNLFDENQRVDLVIQNKSIKEALTILFKGTMLLKVKGSYIILVRKPVPSNVSFTVSGVIFDKRNRAKISNVSIYDKKSLTANISDGNGFYRIRLLSRYLPIRLNISATGFYTEYIWIRNASDLSINIALSPIQKAPIKMAPFPLDDNDFPTLKEPEDTIVAPPRITILRTEDAIPDSTNEMAFPIFVEDNTQERDLWRKLKKRFEQLMVNRSQHIHAQNVTDTLYRNTQVSILPFLGTNKSLSGSITNNVSLNLIAGYSGSVEKLELGLGINIIRSNTNGLQLAGFGNIVGEKTKGVQIGGFFNTNLGNLDGISIAGATVHSWQHVKGFQAAGVLNIIHKSLNGVQFSTGINVLGTLNQGGQIAGLANFVFKESNGLQLGMLNFAHKVSSRGKQIGILNIVDSTESTPIGLLSLVGRSLGYKRLEALIDEGQGANFYFKTGVPKFYNIFTLGYNFIRTKNTINLGYGFGRAYNLNRSWMANSDLTASIMAEQRDAISYNLGTLLKLAIGFEKQSAKHSSITFGPCLKAIIVDKANSSYANGRPFQRIPTYNPLRYTDSFTLWFGFEMGLRLLQR